MEHEFVVYKSSTNKVYYLCWVDGTLYNCVAPYYKADMDYFAFLDLLEHLNEYGEVSINTYEM